MDDSTRLPKQTQRTTDTEAKLESVEIVARRLRLRADTPNRAYANVMLLAFTRSLEIKEALRALGGWGMSDYPTDRKSCGFAIRYLRWLFTSGAVNEIGPDAAALLAAVVTLEDEFHYERAPNFYNSQLMQRCGMLSVKTLIRTRQRAIDAGLLVYTPGKKRSPGRYFVSGFTVESTPKRERNGNETGMKRAPSKPHTPNPIPKNGDSLFSGVKFDQFWNAYPPRKGTKAGKQDAVKAFDKINVAEHANMMRAVRNYAESGQMPKDASRFLKDDYWRDWIETTDDDTVKPFPERKRRVP